MKGVLWGTVAACVLTTAALAQTSEVGQRTDNQQDRIAHGVKSGQLTAGETSNLEKKESAINQEVHTDRALDGGKLTAAEKTQVNRQQNRLSGRIYNDKHNSSTQHYANNEVDARRENQQDRIANGIASGKMNAAQASRIEKGESAINHEVHTDRSLNGGKLTPGERKMVNRQQNVASRKIYNDKHR
ncbi:MAG TPA: hypothetical protein VMB03_14505 [Bryobacteraceae bacterium]|nr:hypothetical protein [Bryobacteraceae bacterium]